MASKQIKLPLDEALRLHKEAGGEDLSGKVQPGAPASASVTLDDTTAEALHNAIKKGLISASCIGIGDDG